MSLRLRLSLILGSAFLLLWTLTATWLLFDLRNQTMLALDQRLAASARMVAGLVAQLPADLLNSLDEQRLSAQQLGIPNGLRCQVSSLRGTVLARSHALPGDPLDPAQKGYRSQTIDGLLWRSYTLINDEGLRITTADRLDERSQLERSIWLSAMVPALVALLGSLAILWLGIGKGLAPLTRIREALARRSADDLRALPDQDLPSELQPLVTSQNLLLERIAAAMERERSLTNNMAHELRSPLTVIKTCLQVARMTDGAAAEQALANAEQGADRLQRTLEQLLLLARLEGQLPLEDDEPLSAREVAELAIHDVSPAPVALQLTEPLTSTPLAMPTVLAITALRNLLENAVRHTPPGTRVELWVAEDTGRVRFTVRDHGAGVPDTHLSRLTQRFWSQGNGNGLGLAIVQAIAERCAARLDFDNRPDGLRVSLSVPLRAS
ncbi:MAG TPA: ATP-binding protein [Pseudomonas sp.]|uniref:sensor histidine kinase n=1 Tax=Pseudomonas sp. TaxID=306 RepID=UPI002C88011A|nr:ATP-binding protein [Pseudomonas sp.]HTO20054.1 ATP-binding protein [Pseudomonas sp.]